jgi:hypothetical protein
MVIALLFEREFWAKGHCVEHWVRLFCVEGSTWFPYVFLIFWPQSIFGAWETAPMFIPCIESSRSWSGTNHVIHYFIKPSTQNSIMRVNSVEHAPQLPQYPSQSARPLWGDDRQWRVLFWGLGTRVSGILILNQNSPVESSFCHAVREYGKALFPWRETACTLIDYRKELYCEYTLGWSSAQSQSDVCAVGRTRKQYAAEQGHQVIRPWHSSELRANLSPFRG